MALKMLIEPIIFEYLKDLIDVHNTKKDFYLLNLIALFEDVIKNIYLDLKKGTMEQ